MNTTASSWVASAARVLWRALALVVFIVLAEVPGILLYAGPLALNAAAALATEFFTHAVRLAFGLALTLELYEHRRHFKRPRLAVIGTVIITSAVATFAAMVSPPGISQTLGMSESIETFRLHEIWLSLFETAVALVFVMQRDTSRSAESQLRQHALQWRLARSRADAVVARASLMRLEPDVLFNTLRDTRETYLVDAGRADASLEALTTYLRAVLQQSKSGRATLSDEFDLASARMRLGDFSDGPVVMLSAEPHVAAMPVPAGLLPQLLYDWTRTLAPGGPSPAVIHATASIEGLRLALRFDAPSLPPKSVLDPVLLQLAAAAGKEAEEMVRYDGKESFSLYLESHDDA